MDDLIEALLLIRTRANPVSPTHCEHDELWVLADADLYTEEELQRLEELGFFRDAEGGFKSFRFGSG